MSDDLEFLEAIEGTDETLKKQLAESEANVTSLKEALALSQVAVEQAAKSVSACMIATQHQEQRLIKLEKDLTGRVAAMEHQLASVRATDSGQKALEGMAKLGTAMQGLGARLDRVGRNVAALRLGVDDQAGLDGLVGRVIEKLPPPEPTVNMGDGPADSLELCDAMRTAMAKIWTLEAWVESVERAIGVVPSYKYVYDKELGVVSVSAARGPTDYDVDLATEHTRAIDEIAGRPEHPLDSTVENVSGLRIG